jgi:hypothetical protein
MTLRLDVLRDAATWATGIKRRPQLAHSERTRRLAAGYERLHQSIPFDLRVDVALHIALLEPLASEAIQPEHPMATPRPDPRGLG